jgi:hypothetical protein
MFINIITPCSRPKNLHTISKSINIPEDSYRWIVVYDSDIELEKELIPNNCEFYLHKNPKSMSGNSQRNYALDLIDDGYVYFNDDDTILHKDLWDNIKMLDNDFISFYQSWGSGQIRLYGDVEYQRIDSHNFILHKNIIGESRWVLDKYEADGLFAIECHKKSKNPIVIKKVLSVYNYLR